MKLVRMAVFSLICICIAMSSGVAIAANNDQGNGSGMEVNSVECINQANDEGEDSNNGAIRAGRKEKKSRNKDGSIPAKWNLEKPKLKSHPDIAPSSASGNGDGSNSISFAEFDSGDIIVVTGTLTGHAGEWDDPKYGNIDSKCVWSANTSPANGVQLETPRKYRGYDEAYGIWVPAVSEALRTSAKNYCTNQNSEP